VCFLIVTLQIINFNHFENSNNPQTAISYGLADKLRNCGQLRIADLRIFRLKNPQCSAIPQIAIIPQLPICGEATKRFGTHQFPTSSSCHIKLQVEFFYER
jgi:hypothetical protein